MSILILDKIVVDCSKSSVVIVNVEILEPKYIKDFYKIFDESVYNRIN